VNVPPSVGIGKEQVEYTVPEYSPSMPEQRQPAVKTTSGGVAVVGVVCNHSMDQIIVVMVISLLEG
jgi:hypothetical protein